MNLNRILHSLWSSFEEIQHRKNLSKNCQMMTLREICGTLPFLAIGTHIRSSRRIKKDLPWFSGLAQYYVGIQVTGVVSDSWFGSTV
jgi:hypothetical protein